MSNRTKIDEGGFAFPTSQISAPDGRVLSAGQDGMSIRDYFAAKAMMATLTNAKAANEESFPALMDTVARLSYMCADAMIAARKAGAA